jgi:hypothetical protein
MGMHPSVSIRQAIEDALPSVPTTPRDLATAALARRIADDIDQAELVHVEAQSIIDDLAADGVDAATIRRLTRVMARIERTAVLASLGPRLLSVLIELGMTPASRAALVKGRPAGDDDERREPVNDLDRIRQQRAARRPR